MKRTLFASSICLVLLAACGGSEEADPRSSQGTGAATTARDGHAHDHVADHAHGDDHRHGPGHGDHGHDHAHDEVPLGKHRIGELEVTLAQGHGPLVAGEESHLVVKLPYTDGGATVVRAWIGSADRTLSYVGRGDYARSHDDYDVHATAPEPLPGDASWWVEIEQPDGTKHLGSAPPVRR